MVSRVTLSMCATTYKFLLRLSSGHALHILLHKFLIPLGRVAEPLWPWHMSCRIQALTQGQAGYQ